MKRGWPGWVALIVSGLFAVAGITSWMVYSSQMSVVRALRGATTTTEHEYRLRRAVSLDSSNGLARLQLARAASVKRQHSEALDLHKEGMKTYRPFSSYEELGRLQERMAAGEPARREEFQTMARKTYEDALLLHPGDLSLLKRLAELCLRQGDRDGVMEYTEAILKRSLNDLDAVFFRALDAEAAGEYQRSYRLIQQIAGRSSGAASRYYTTESLAAKRRALESLGARRGL